MLRNTQIKFIFYVWKGMEIIWSMMLRNVEVKGVFEC